VPYLAMVAYRRKVAAEPTDPIDVQVRYFVGARRTTFLDAPIFRMRINPSSSEHGAESSSWDLGDAFGTDCFVEKEVQVDGRSWARPYSGNGNQNQDWYSWRREVLSPCTCKVLEVSINPESNQPGQMGTKPASLFKLERDDDVIFHLAHFDKPLVKVGDSLLAGQVIAQVGNNGLSRHPHIHVGAYQGSEPLQIRFDQQFMKPMEA
jgi:hypothetical protein